MGGGGVTQFNTVAYATDSSAGYYETEIKTPNLGNYQFEVEAHEKPSHETLPIIGKDYFPKTVATFATEVDNTAPSAKYKSKPIVKVDVVFALGELSQTSALQNYIPKFTSDLETASNNIDARVEQVKTSTFDISQVSAQHIMDTWINYPGSRISSNYEAGWMVMGNALGATTNVNWTGFWSKEFIEIKDATFDFVANVGNHQDPQGWTFRMSESGGVYSFYALEINHNYSRINLARIDRWVPGQYNTHGGPLYHGMINGEDGTYNGGTGQAGSYQGATGQFLATARDTGIGSGGGSQRYKIVNNGNNIKVYIGGSSIPAIDYTDNSGRALTQGSFGPYTCSQFTSSFGDIKVEMGATKSLGEAISDVAWRDNSVRFIIHATDKIPADMQNTNSADYQYTVTKLYNSNAYLINLGTSVNRDVLDRLVKDITGTDGDTKGTFFYNSPISSAMDSSSSWIINKVTGLAKPTDWILVNQEILWETDYTDNEHDLPLNFGKNSYDITLAGKWGVSLTNYYSYDKVLAEKWRYSHNPVFYDNSTELAAFSQNWIPDPVTVFQNPGLYRVNYKRLDNPFYPDANLSNAFGNYRYWSTDYDRRAGA